ncbi:M15 family metallopeptidase [Prochlorococcus sp. MIT 1307]|uniref:M15 family metallopeptidase n=1 Tax=Prochlorococcus sp. MIT 1307 TaxID=3096219 RepID=UPI002A74B2C1|nr:M15 family metallopeptidase [Prochlorococcus sp. MIT 1307]
MRCFERRPWNDLPIVESGEELVKLKSNFFCLEPHPYLSLGAPYGENVDPWRLRTGVFNRLVLAQNYLKKDFPEFRLAIFDAWRPIPVQAFMVEKSIEDHCILRGVDRKNPDHKVAFTQVVKDVEQFWAPPSLDPNNPPPHSTGGAVDLTLANIQGNLLDMGSKIDEIGDISSPNYFLLTAKKNVYCDLWHQRRLSLAMVMKKAGFVQHPNEWWHFSYGDQLWAWSRNLPEAIYGSCTPPVSREEIA